MEIIAPRAALWLDTLGPRAKYNIAESYVEPVRIRELLEMDPRAGGAFLDDLLDTKLDYGEIDGSRELREGIAGFYQDKSADCVMLAHGAIAANLIALLALVSPGDRVVIAHPNYQQLYAVPQALGADVRTLELREEDGFLPDADELRRCMGETCRLLILTNPNNPTGSVMDEAALRQAAQAAREAGAYLLCDEIYLGYPREGVRLARAADVYEKGISTGSFSKVYGLSGARIGWVCAAPEILELLAPYRNYTSICCGQLGDAVACLGMRNFDALMRRNNEILYGNLAHLKQWLLQNPQVRCEIPKAGTFVLLRYDFPVDSATLCTQLFERYGTFVMPGCCFDLEGCLRLGIGGDRETFAAGLACLSAYFRSLKEEADA